MASLAQMERELILERTRAGLCPTEGNDGVGENSTLKLKPAPRLRWKRICLKICERTVILPPVALRIGSTPWVRWEALWKGQNSCPFTAIAIVSRTAARQASNPIKRHFRGAGH